MTTPTPIPPHIELRMRQQGETVWNATYASDPDVTPKKAFAEGFYFAYSVWAQISARQQLELELWRGLASSMLIGLAVAAVVVGALSR
jgi:hypothetical protein